MRRAHHLTDCGSSSPVKGAGGWGDPCTHLFRQGRKRERGGRRGATRTPHAPLQPEPQLLPCPHPNTRKIEETTKKCCAKFKRMEITWDREKRFYTFTNSRPGRFFFSFHVNFLILFQPEGMYSTSGINVPIISHLPRVFSSFPYLGWMDLRARARGAIVFTPRPPTVIHQQESGVYSSNKEATGAGWRNWQRLCELDDGERGIEDEGFVQ
jgi:hypothetical protein